MGAGKAVGVDLSEKCIKAAKKRFKNDTRAEFYQGDISNLEMFKRSIFDAVICLGTINYLNPKRMKLAMNEFIRVIKPGGKVIILFQKDKGFVIQCVKKIANLLSLKLYLFLIENFSFILLPLMPLLVGRKISLNYLKYDILLSLRGLHFGVPVKIDEKFRVKTLTCEQCSELTTASYKIIVAKRRA